MNVYNMTLNNGKTLADYPAVIATEASVNTSSKYGFIPTTRVIDVLASRGWLPTNAQATKSEKAHSAKHLIRFAQANSLERKESERVEIVLRNSHDAKSSFLLNLGVWRMVCSNGMMVGETYQSHSITHMGYTDDAVNVAIDDITDTAPKMLEGVSALKGINLDPREKEAFANAVIEMAFDDEEQSFVEIGSVLRPRRYDDRRNDLWTTFNVAQENLMRGGIVVTKPVEKTSYSGKTYQQIQRRKRPSIKNIDKNVKLNKALWSLTEKMAELKGVNLH